MPLPIFKVCFLYLVYLTTQGSPTLLATEEDIPRGESKATFYRGTGISKVAGYVLSLAGQKAWLSLLHGSRRLTPRFAKTQRYQKSGDFDVALKQFMSLNPSHVRMKESADGVVTSVSGRVGDRLFSVKKTTRGQTGKAIVTAKVDKANYRQPKQPDTITYLGNEEVKSNVWWLAD